MLKSTLPPSQSDRPEPPSTRDYSRLHQSAPTPEMLKSLHPGLSKTNPQSPVGGDLASLHCTEALPELSAGTFPIDISGPELLPPRSQGMVATGLTSMSMDRLTHSKPTTPEPSSRASSSVPQADSSVRRSSRWVTPNIQDEYPRIYQQVLDIFINAGPALAVELPRLFPPGGSSEESRRLLSSSIPNFSYLSQSDSQPESQLPTAETLDMFDDLIQPDDGAPSRGALLPKKSEKESTLDLSTLEQPILLPNASAGTSFLGERPGKCQKKVRFVLEEE
ncbi:hypothetical protein NLI96_g13040 [Meripilus lineatus]|uniref:Uncharacterized protein n=1 Tax=Meripilus lineatus TaxID=2056292 RepID=A0AAD5UP19_9APHY|nr:hypothetical protein NLI96_g13040 [Physisporinus lineatus]